MRHVRFDLATVVIEGVPVLLKAAYLLVVEADDGPHPHWEVLAYALDTAPIDKARYRVALTTLDGRELTGDAVLVRSVEGAHVLRGDGPLDGVEDHELT